MNNVKNYLLLFLMSFILVGCSIKGNQYKPDIQLINELNNYELKSVNTASIKNKLDSHSISLRAAKMVSPYGTDFSDYLNNAMRIQLSQNKLYNENSNMKITTELVKNEVDIWGFSNGYYDIEVNFKILKENEMLYSNIVDIKHTFPSHFVGQIAIENAINNYPIAIKKLISKFFEDKKVINILKQTNEK